MPQTPIFIISSGRTGSTFIAETLNKHKKICVISELIEPLKKMEFFEKKNISGKTFYEIISKPCMKERIQAWRIKKTKELKFLPKSDKDVSLLNAYCLPSLFKNTVSLTIEIKKYFENIKKDKSYKILIKFFEFLKKKTKKKIWIERTGGSSMHIKKILELYPNAKIIHIRRNCFDTILSMQKHLMFKMFIHKLQNRKLTKQNLKKKANLIQVANLWKKWENFTLLNLKNHPKKLQFHLFYDKLDDKNYKALNDMLKFIFNKNTIDSADKEVINIFKKTYLKKNRISLNKSQKKIIWKISKNTMNQLGYNEFKI